MNMFISLKLAGGGTLAVRPEAIDSVEAHVVDYETIVLRNGKLYNILPGQFTLNKLGEHCMHAGVRVA